MGDTRVTVPDFERVAIVGVGLLGASLGLALRRCGFGGGIVGIGRREVTLRAAQWRGAVDDIALEVGAAEGCDLVVLATPLSAFEGLFEQLGRVTLPSSAVVTDVGSVKRSVVGMAERLLGRPERFVGSHPMAGSEQRGPEAATVELFEGRPLVLTPTDRTDAEAAARVEQLWRGLGMRVIRMTPERHDQAVARVSHLPHALAALVVDLASKRGGLEVASSGFADSTRIASGDAEIWADIFLQNADLLLGAIDEASTWMDDFCSLLKQGDREALVERLVAIKSARDSWRCGMGGQQAKEQGS